MNQQSIRYLCNVSCGLLQRAEYPPRWKFWDRRPRVSDSDLTQLQTALKECLEQLKETP